MLLNGCKRIKLNIFSHKLYAIPSGVYLFSNENGMGLSLVELNWEETANEAPFGNTHCIFLNKNFNWKNLKEIDYNLKMLYHTRKKRIGNLTLVNTDTLQPKGYCYSIHYLPSYITRKGFSVLKPTLFQGQAMECIFPLSLEAR